MLVIYFIFKKISTYFNKKNILKKNSTTNSRFIFKKTIDKKNLKKINKTDYFIKTTELNNNLNKNTFSLLRKQRFFTKSKYSRTRQYCKNIVYLGLVINIVAIFSINSVFYGITLNFHKKMFIGFIFLLTIVLLLIKLKVVKSIKKLIYYIFKK